MPLRNLDWKKGVRHSYLLKSVKMGVKGSTETEVPKYRNPSNRGEGRVLEELLDAWTSRLPFCSHPKVCLKTKVKTFFSQVLRSSSVLKIVI
jgi:hypothetical protein